MNFIINDFEIYYQKYGKGKTNILILPGWGDTRSTFNKLIEQMKNYFTIYIIDYPGFGNSLFPKRDLNMDDYAKLIKNFITILNINTPIVIGHSFGGRIISLLTTKHKVKFKKIVLIDSAGIKQKKKLRTLIKQYIYKGLKKLGNILPKKLKQKYQNKLINMFGSTDLKSLDPNIRKTFINIINEDLTEYFKRIKCDTLIIWGELDKDTPLKDGYKINKLIDDSGLVILKNCSHFPYLENPHYVNKIIYEFIKVFATKKED